MQYEFEQLLEALWAGRLDQAGRRRLSELCAADPKLAARLRQERNLTGLLSHCGPNHAPAGLASSVMAKMHARNYLRSRAPWHAAWIGWIFRPAIRTALAFTAIAAIGVEAGLLMHNWQTPASTTAAAPLAAKPDYQNVAILDQKPAPTRRVASLDPETIKKQNEKTAARATAARKITGGEVKSAAPVEPKKAAVFSPQGDVRTEEFPGPGVTVSKGDIVHFNDDRGFGGGGLSGAPQLAMNDRNTYDMKVPLAPAASAPAAPAPASAPAATPTVPLDANSAAPAVPGPANSAKYLTGHANPEIPRAKALPDREVAMAITLNTAIRPPAAYEHRADKPIDPLNNIPYKESFTNAPRGQAPAEALTHKQIEIDLYAVDQNAVVKSNPIPDRKGSWEIRASLTPEQFRRFAQGLREKGILPGATVTSNNPTDSDLLRTASTLSHYDITRGVQWLKPLEKIMAESASQVAGTSATRGMRSATAKAKTADRLEIRIVVDEIKAPLTR